MLSSPSPRPPRRSNSLRWWVATALLGAAGLAAWWLQGRLESQAAARQQAEQQLARQAAAAARERGRQLFMQGDGLPGRMARHAQDLPPLATRCGNCHALEPGVMAGAVGLAAAGDGAPSLPAAAPVLGPDGLTQLRSRRGGPASRFDAQALCTLLTTGLDPAQVVVAVTMPRYQATPAQCQDIWHFLVPTPPAAL